MSIVCHVLVHDSPKPFDRVQVGAVRRQLDKMDTIIWPCEKFSGIRPFDEWTEVFGSERLTGALLDRLTHHVHILEMNGESYRLKHSRNKQK